MSRIFFVIAAVLVPFLASLARAEDDPPAELIPPPQAAPIITEMAPPVLPYMRHDRYEVWQNYAVDHYGRFRPLVVYGPWGAYYRYNGQPFPWAENHPLEWMPYVTDTPNR